ncbi:MAG: hypothetical protein AAF687_09215 [Pseudomonadota bacterium]
MALLVLIVIGALLGWLASILGRTEEPRAIVSQIAIGLFASLVAGLILNNYAVLGGLSPIALGAAVAASVVSLALYHVVARRSAA